MSKTFDEFLSHYGVRGMRWGVRKKSNSDSESEPTAPKKSTKSSEPEASGKKTTNKKQNVNDLTDAQLREALNRLQMEKQYRELTAQQPRKLNAGKKFAGEVVRQVAKETVVSVAKSHASKYTAQFMAQSGQRTAEKLIKDARKAVG